MSATVSAFGHRGTTSSVKTEISRELVNASDGAGLHFENNGYVDLGNVAAAKFGTSDFSIEFVLNQTAENSIDNYIYFTNISGKNRAFFRNDISENLVRITFSNSSNSETAADIAYDMSADYGTPTHYVLTFDRDGDATLYKNGSIVNESFVRSYPNQTTGAYPAKSCVLVLAASDYVELYGQHTKGSNAEFNLNYTFLQGHKLIGV